MSRWIEWRNLVVMNANLYHELRRSLTCWRAGFGLPAGTRDDIALRLKFIFLGAIHLRLCVFARVFFLPIPRAKFVPWTTKIPHLLKGRFRDDILALGLIFKPGHKNQQFSYIWENTNKNWLHLFLKINMIYSRKKQVINLVKDKKL